MNTKTFGKFGSFAIFIVGMFLIVQNAQGCSNKDSDSEGSALFPASKSGMLEADFVIESEKAIPITPKTKPDTPTTVPTESPKNGTKAKSPNSTPTKSKKGNRRPALMPASKSGIMRFEKNTTDDDIGLMPASKSAGGGFDLHPGKQIEGLGDLGKGKGGTANDAKKKDVKPQSAQPAQKAE